MDGPSQPKGLVVDFRRDLVKVLFITGYAENAAIGNVALGRGMQVTTKPFGVDELARKIHAMIEGS